MVRLFRLLGRLPLALLQRVGAWLGWLVWALSGRYRQRFEDQAAAAGFSPAQYRPARAAIGTMVAELPWLWLRPANQGVLHLVQWDGVEHFENAMDAGKGVILAVPHLGCWEMMGQALAERYGPKRGPLVALYRPARKAWLAPLVASSRDRPGLKAVPTSVSGVRSLLRVLRGGGYLLAGISFFLYGSTMASYSLEKLMATRITSLMNKVSSSHFLSITVGVALTTILQSSGAVTSMLVGLGTARVIKLPQVMGIIMFLWFMSWKKELLFQPFSGQPIKTKPI